jgi:hypothetical protein
MSDKHIKPKKYQVLVTYKATVAIKVPKGIDLNAPGVKYYVKWGDLYISLPNGEEVLVRGPDTDIINEAINWKYPKYEHETDTDSSDSDSDEDSDSDSNSEDKSEVFAKE